MTIDSNNARQRLLDAALEVFATKGYASASTREICRLAGANVSAIHYYFGDKASLYRELFERVSQFLQVPAGLNRTDIPLEDALLALYRHLLSVTVSPARSQRMRALLVREQLQPTGMLSETQLRGLAPFYNALLDLLERHFKVDTPDNRLQCLAFSLLGLPSMLMIDRELVDEMAPELVTRREETARELAEQALTLVQHECHKRSQCQRNEP